MSFALSHGPHRSLPLAGPPTGRPTAADARSGLRPLAGTAATCANWFNGRCEICGVPWEGYEVDATYHCPAHRDREEAA